MALLISCWSILAQQVRTLFLRSSNSVSLHILLQSTPDSIINGVLPCLCPDCSAAMSEVSMKLGTFCCRNSTVNFARYTVFPIVFSVELGCFHLFYPITNCWKIFARNLHMLLRIDYISTCVIHFEWTLLLEDIISSHVWGRFFHGPLCM